MHQGGLQWCNCLHHRFRVIFASYRLRQKPRHDSGRAKPPPRSWRATLVPLPKQKKKGRTSTVLIYICPSVTANEKQGIPHSSTIYNTIFTSSGFGWLLQPRSKSFWWQIDFGLDLSRCWVALWPAVLSRHGSGRVCLGAWGIPSASGGHPPRLLLPSGRLGSSPGAWGAPNKGNADGAVGIFGKCRARVGYGPAPGPTIKKALCHTCPLGGAVNKYLGWLLQPRSKSFWRQIDFGLDLSRCWVALWLAVLSRHGSGRVCLGAWGFPSA